MDTDKVFKQQDSESGFDIEKRNRRSSILKPRKSISCPIDESSQEVVISGKASRRVSFANINFIKPFASDPEKTTIWDNTYEEEVNHSDSAKSVDTVCPGLLNTTSLSFPEFENKESVGKAPFQIWESASSSKYIHYEIAQGVEECDKENVLPLVKTIVSKNETIIFERADADIEFTGSYANVDFSVPKSIVEFVKNRPSQNKSVASNRTDLEMELTCSFPNTEVVKRTETSCETISKSPNEAKNKTICSTDDMEFTLATDNSFSNNMECTTIVGAIKSLSNNEPCSNNEENKFRQLSQNNNSCKLGFAEAEQIDDMEFTTNLCDIKRGLPDCKVLDPNIPEAEMEFTCNLTNFKQPFLTCEQATSKENTQSVIGGNYSEADMEFTTNLAVPPYFSGTTAVPPYFSGTTALSKQSSVDNGSDDQMEYTTNLPNIKHMYGRVNFSDHSVLKPQQSVISKIIQERTENISEEIDMEFTTNLAKPKYFSSGIQTVTDETYQSNQLEKIECSVYFRHSKQVDNHPEEHKSEEIDMEFTTNLAIYKQSSNAIPPVMAESIIYNQMCIDSKSEDMECTTVVPNAKQIFNNLHDLSSGNPCTETVQTTVGNHSEEFTISSDKSKKSLNPASSSQQFGELKSEDTKQVQNSSKEMYSNRTTLEPSSTVRNIDGQAVDGNKSRALGSKFTDDSTVSKEVSGVVKTIKTDMVVLPSSILNTEQLFSGLEKERNDVHTTVERHSGNDEYKTDFAQLNLCKNRNWVSGKDNTDEVVATQNHKQVENDGNDEFKNREDNNILYSEQGNLLLKHDEYLPVFGKNPVTPTTSFAMNFSNMSPCIEDTQQLIHATFSKPESIDVLLTGRKVQININENKNDSKDSICISQLNDISDNFKQTHLISAETVQPTNRDIKTNENFWDLSNASHDIIYNTTPDIIDRSMPIEEEVLKNQEDSIVKMEPDLEVSVESSTRDSLDYQNYTMRSNRILNDIKKHLVYMQSDPYLEESVKRCEKVCHQYYKSKAWITLFVENYRLPKIDVVDLEEYFKEDSEDSSTSRMSEGLSNDEADDQQRLSMPNLALPKSLYERVREAAERSGKYWHFVKSENDFYHFDGLFKAISFKTHVHPELGIVYGIETRNKLAEESSPLAHYEAKVFEIKLKHENLLPALGPKFDIFSLLDYVCLCIDEITSFHKEFHQLLNKYGSSHKLTVHRDNRVTFEILHFDFIIWWTITIEMSLNNIGCKECISANYNGKVKVDEGNIKQIAENCPKGMNFLRCFIEKVDEYVQRIGMRIDWQKGSRENKSIKS